MKAHFAGVVGGHKAERVDSVFEIVNVGHQGAGADGCPG